MIKDLFTGSLGKLNNHGGSRIYTTPNTILVPPEYEVDIGEHGDFISCSLDGRLWLFKNKIIALKWNEETGRMEFSASRSFNNNQFIARGLDWILTKTYIIQYNNGKIVVEAHKIKDIQPMENFYSLLPALDGFQIIKGYLIRKPGAEHTDLVYPVENAGIFLIPNGSEIWGKKNNSIGEVTIILANKNKYELEIINTYSTDENITGIIFLNGILYGFINDENNKGLCYSSQILNLYSFDLDEWETLSEATGKIYFDVFNQKALALHDKGMEILPDRKKVECNALEQWIAPSKELHYVSNNIIVSAFSDKVLATNLILKYYRSLLKANKELPITATAYQNNEGKPLKLAVGNVSNKLNFNSLNTTPFYYYKDIDIEINIIDFYLYNDFRVSNFSSIIDITQYPYKRQSQIIWRPDCYIYGEDDSYGDYVNNNEYIIQDYPLFFFSTGNYKLYDVENYRNKYDLSSFIGYVVAIQDCSVSCMYIDFHEKKIDCIEKNFSFYHNLEASEKSLLCTYYDFETYNTFLNNSKFYRRSYKYELELHGFYSYEHAKTEQYDDYYLCNLPSLDWKGFNSVALNSFSRYIYINTDELKRFYIEDIENINISDIENFYLSVDIKKDNSIQSKKINFLDLNIIKDEKYQNALLDYFSNFINTWKNIYNNASQHDKWLYAETSLRFQVLNFYSIKYTDEFGHILIISNTENDTTLLLFFQTSLL